MQKRTLIIGDIHGAARALVQVLDRCAATTEDTLIFLGDYVDGWSESAQVIDVLMALDKSHSCIFIKGNHDEWCEDWLRDGRIDSSWWKHGGESTAKSYKGFTDEKKNAHLGFYRRMQNYHMDADNNLFIHAGFASMHGPEHETHRSNFQWDRTLWEMALATDKEITRDSPYFPKRLKLFKEIFIGHTPTTNYKIDVPMNVINLWNVDTGAAFNGKLTVLDLATKEYWQSDVVRTLYPEEKGRNAD